MLNTEIYPACSSENDPNLIPFLDELEKITDCPKKTRLVEMHPCVLIRCKHHAIHKLRNPLQLAQMTDDEILSLLFQMKDGCSIEEESENYGISYTYAEIEVVTNIPRKRIEQTEFKALRKLKNHAKNMNLKNIFST